MLTECVTPKLRNVNVAKAIRAPAAISMHVIQFSTHVTVGFTHRPNNIDD